MNLRVCDMEEINLKQKERAIAIREWGMMARSGAGLGYGACTLSSGRGEPPLSVEEFTKINDAVYQLAIRPRTVIILKYKSDRSIRQIAENMGDNRDNITMHHRDGISTLFGALCMSRAFEANAS